MFPKRAAFKKGNLRIKRYKPQGKLFRKILFRGLPEAIAQFSTSVTTLCMNRTLMAAFGDIGINAFAIILYLSSFTMSVFFGASELRIIINHQNSRPQSAKTKTTIFCLLKFGLAVYCQHLYINTF